MAEAPNCSASLLLVRSALAHGRDFNGVTLAQRRDQLEQIRKVLFNEPKILRVRIRDPQKILLKDWRRCLPLLGKD
jgi:hypothetical protein